MSGASREITRASVFNHKGGVGKTTLTVNLAFALVEKGYRVLLVDSDPQCNLTSYLVEPQVVDTYLDNSEEVDGQTIWTALRPVSEGAGDFRYVKPIERRERLFLLPGDIQLAQFESDLSSLWMECQGRKIRGFKGTTALSRLVSEMAAQVEAQFVFYDSGPNIGPLNRAILLDCHCFAIPTAYDSFSLRALKTVGRALFEWISDWTVISDLAGQGVPLLRGRPSLLGYIPAGFRTYGTQPANSFRRFLPLIQKEVSSQVVEILTRIDPALAIGTLADYKLGEVKQFGTLVTEAQQQGVPLWETTGSPSYQRDEARKAFFDLADRFLARVASYRESGK